MRHTTPPCAVSRSRGRTVDATGSAATTATLVEVAGFCSPKHGTKDS